MRLNRPHVRNAFDGPLIRRLTEVFEEAAGQERLRALVLSGEGPAFCAGADVQAMRESATATPEQNLSDARALSRLFEALDGIPFLTLARVHGAALGGGGGLVAAVDVAVATPSTRFGFTEVRLGIVPAVISPYVSGKIGTAAARRYFTTGEFFDGARAATLGLVSEVVEEDRLDARVAEITAGLRSVGPRAAREAKALARWTGPLDPDRREVLAQLIAAIRTTPEAREGLAAFLEKRPPAFGKETP